MELKATCGSLFVEYERIGENWIAHLIDSRLYGAGPTRSIALKRLSEAVASCDKWLAIGSSSKTEDPMADEFEYTEEDL